VYERDNPRGWHREWWLHVGGCRRLLLVVRHTLSHEIRASVDAAESATLAPEPGA
jgi:sarcosine oxidase subunit delta